MDINGGAWCAKHMVSRALKEYLQIDLLQPHVITAVRTQGRFGRGQGQEYTEAYVIEYWRPGMKWTRWKNAQGKEVSGKEGKAEAQEVAIHYVTVEFYYLFGDTLSLPRTTMQCNGKDCLSDRPPKTISVSLFCRSFLAT